MVFRPNQPTFRAAPRICMCESCIESYGSCDLFQDYYITYSHVGNVSTRSTEKAPVEQNDDVSVDFISPDTFVAVRPGVVGDSFWLIHVTETDCTAGENTVDDNRIKIPFKDTFNKGYSLEKAPPYTTKTHRVYQKSKKSTYFYSETVVYPFVQVETHKNKYLLSNEEYVLVDEFIRANGLAHI